MSVGAGPAPPLFLLYSAPPWPWPARGQAGSRRRGAAPASGGRPAARLGRTTARGEGDAGRWRGHSGQRRARRRRYGAGRALARPGAARALLAECGGGSRAGHRRRDGVLAPVAQEPEGKGVGEDEGIVSELTAGSIWAEGGWR